MNRSLFRWMAVLLCLCILPTCVIPTTAQAEMSLLQASDQWVYQAFLGNASRKLYVQKGMGTDGEKVLHKGEIRSEHREYVYYMVTNESVDGGLLVLGVPLLERLIRSRCFYIDLRNGWDEEKVRIDLRVTEDFLRELGVLGTDAELHFQLESGAQDYPMLLSLAKEDAPVATAAPDAFLPVIHARTAVPTATPEVAPAPADLPTPGPIPTLAPVSTQPPATSTPGVRTVEAQTLAPTQSPTPRPAPAIDWTPEELTDSTTV